MMTTDKKLAFLHKMTKLGLDSIPHYDAGGQVGPLTQASQTLGSVTPLYKNISEPFVDPILGSSVGQGVENMFSPVTNMLGLGGLTNNYHAGSANITPGTNPEQLQASYTGAQGALTNQENLANQSQPGIVQGLGTQQSLSGQLANEAAGRGPNPAQAALNQSTGQNIAQQAALAANTRGASSNAGQIAANNARQGAETQQQAVGQAATLQAQQQIAAQQQQQQLAATQYNQGAGAIQGQNQQQQNEQNILQGANTAANNAAVSQQSNINSTNAGVAAGNQAAHGNIFGGLLAGGAAALSAFAKGGEVHKMAQGGYLAPTPLVVEPVQSGPQSFVGQWINSNGNSSQSPIQSSQMQQVNQPGYANQAAGFGTALGNKYADLPGDRGGGGNGIAGEARSGVGEHMMPFEAHGGKIKKAIPMMMGGNEALIARGGKVKAENKSQKAVKNKDSYDNDKVPAMLSEGEVVMDKDTLNDPGQIGQMARAVAQHITQRNKGKKNV